MRAAENAVNRPTSTSRSDDMATASFLGEDKTLLVTAHAGARLTTLGGTGHMMIFEAPLTCRGLVLT